MGKICTGPTTGTYYQYAGGAIEAAKETLGLDLENVSTVGSLENAKGIGSGQCDMAIVQADMYVQSVPLSQSSPEFKLFVANRGSVAALYQESVHILVNQDSGITSIADLAGKKVNVGEKDSGTFLTAYKLLNNYHQLSQQPTYVYEAPAEAVAKVVAGTLDATFYVAAAPISALANLPADANVTLIPATRPVFSSEYSTVSISATTYSWLHKDITDNIAVWSYLAVGPSIDRTQLGSFLDKLYTNKDAYAKKYHAKWSELDKASSITVIKQIPSNGWARESMHYLAGIPLNTSEPQPAFCSGSAQGTYTKVVKDLLPVVKSTLGIDLTEKHTVGTLENLRKLYTHECAMALMQYDVRFYLNSINQAQPGLSEDMLMGFDAIMPLYREDIHLVVNTNSGIQSSLDLAGKKVNLGEKLSGSYMTAHTMLLVNALKVEDITPFYDSSQIGLSKVISGEYDAMFVVGKTPVSSLVAADCPTDTAIPNCIAGDPTTLPIKLVPVQVPYFVIQPTLSAKHYPWQKVDLPKSPQVMSYIVMSPALSIDESRMADFINAVYALKVGDDTHSSTWDETTLEQGFGSFIPFPTFYHQAAAQYFVDKMK
ncbi:MAG TPA: TAXI family TRAP transporter solute-binding subunit [Thiotrichaceae bacterium]|nr:TAXI family TRAP transporter solute-binding subunit [Thiotrichaceae bacterium]